MTDSVCTAPGCDRPARGRYCDTHWSRHKRGSPLDGPVRTKLSAFDRVVESAISVADADTADDRSYALAMKRLRWSLTRYAQEYLVTLPAPALDSLLSRRRGKKKPERYPSCACPVGPQGIAHQRGCAREAALVADRWEAADLHGSVHRKRRILRAVQQVAAAKNPAELESAIRRAKSE